MPNPILTPESVLCESACNSWTQPDPQGSRVTELEKGKVLYLPQLAFVLSPQELALLDVSRVDPKRKNISYNPESGRLTGIADEADRPAIEGLLARHYQSCKMLIAALLPEYQQHLHSPVNTLRLHPVTAWRKSSSWRKDDSRLHVDAFPSRPMHGERILRIFTNINPQGGSREWRIGEDFPQLARRFYPRLGGYSPLTSWLQHVVGITKRRRTRYDALMLQMHDKMKSDAQYQQQGLQLTFQFPPGSSWICFSDQTPHAAMAGQFMLEQTWQLPVLGMKHPEHSPLRVLESLAGRALL
ncbi:3-deoxy-D-manno-oct-2-ulosonic acid (Kdo) hydroxylase [Izhakiella australiensis]|uniref:3-deoxy-D-manno-oct-2-ulosonic acid (Kdo) hydroxylase n=1 Tax=Izhakiella australiensis TaxID=1926881 RepID=A0A1S8YLJ9_9GAMM|nr:Kdo hydroxylase family protein [Izhakiella australiensis]OON39737.1 3-deoxy-D-manno-oct-2-ulosonic acid (Kdo) hydroxylase [Izhakiella australiensis]